MSHYAIIARVPTAYVILHILQFFSSTASAKTRYAVQHVHFRLCANDVIMKHIETKFDL